MSGTAVALPYTSTVQYAESWDYVLRCDRVAAPRERAVFTLRPMTVRESELDERLGRVSSGQRIVAIAIAHVIAIRNFPPGAALRWPDSVEERVQYLEQLDDAHVAEISEAVVARNRVRDDRTIMRLLYAHAHIDTARALSGREIYRCERCFKDPGLLQILGHSAPPASLWTENLLTDEPLTLCPLRALQLAEETDPAECAEVRRYLNTYVPAYERQHLLVAGGIADQPARYVALVEMIREIATEVTGKIEEVNARNKGA